MASNVDDWTSEFFDKAKNSGVDYTSGAVDLLGMVVKAQITEGPQISASKILDHLNMFDMDEILQLYKAKYGMKTLTFNRMVRLLADLHDKWIDLRANLSALNSR